MRALSMSVKLFMVSLFLLGMGCLWGLWSLLGYLG